jgi:ApaG protein
VEKHKSVQISIEIKTTSSYIEAESKPELNYHFFAYHIRISNKGHTTAQLMSRHWVITDGNGHVEEVRGPGVVGVQPRINPGQSFEYESACPLTTTSGSMKGSYQMMSDQGQMFTVEIPEFFLIAPQALH